jgi:hypothetical protein
MDDTPIIVSAVVPGAPCLACTGTLMTISVDPSNGYRPSGAVPAQSAVTAPTTTTASFHTTSSATVGSNPHTMTSMGLLPTTRGSGVPSTDPLELDFPMYPAYDSSYLLPISSESIFDPDTVAGLYEDDAQNRPFSSLATLGSTSSALIPPSNANMFGSQYSRPNFASGLPTMAQKRVLLPSPAHDERSKRRKVDEYPVGVIAGSRGPSTGLQPSHQRSTNAVLPSIPVSSFDRPESMSRDDYVKLLHAKLAAEGING